MGEEEPNGTDFAFAIMLLLSVAFQMTIFYVVNWPDVDIRTYAWDIIGNTILIFTGVLIFAACDGFTDYFVADRFPEHAGTVQFVQLLFWYAVLQFVSAFSSGLFHAKGAAFTHINVETMRREVCDKAVGLKERKRNAECFCSLLGHITAFAAIHSFGFLQDETRLGDTAFGSYAVSWIALGGLCLLFAVAGRVRNYLMKFYPGKEECLDHWQEITADVENDICGLACSFLAFLALRFFLVGKLPSIEGTVVATPAEVPELFPKVLLAGAGFAVMGVGVLWVHLKSGYVDAEEELAPATRISNIAQNFCNMSVSWAALLNTNYFIRYMGWFESCEVIPAKIMISFVTTYLALFCIWILDKVDDRLKETGAPSDWMKNIITALGLAVGFAWEQSFDTAVDDVSEVLQEHFRMPKATLVWLKMAGAGILVAVVLPAYRLHIQPIIEATDEAKEEADKKIAKRVSVGLAPQSDATTNAKAAKARETVSPLEVSLLDREQRSNALEGNLLDLDAKVADLDSSSGRMA